MALAKSTHNFQIKLILVRLYIVLGVSSRALAIYKTMDIKQIQFDTMLHYFTDRLISLGCVNELESHLHQSTMIYKSNDVEVSWTLGHSFFYRMLNIIHALDSWYAGTSLQVWNLLKGRSSVFSGGHSPSNTFRFKNSSNSDLGWIIPCNTRSPGWNCSALMLSTPLSKPNMLSNTSRNLMYRCWNWMVSGESGGTLWDSYACLCLTLSF